MIRFLLVEDEMPAMRRLENLISLGPEEWEICATAKNGRDGYLEYCKQKPDVIITDIQMPVENGLAMLRRIRETDRQVAIIILSCHESFAFAREAISQGVNDYILKDQAKLEDLLLAVSRVRGGNEHIEQLKFVPESKQAPALPFIGEEHTFHLRGIKSRNSKIVSVCARTDRCPECHEAFWHSLTNLMDASAALVEANKSIGVVSVTVADVDLYFSRLLTNCRLALKNISESRRDSIWIGISSLSDMNHWETLAEEARRAADIAFIFRKRQIYTFNQIKSINMPSENDLDLLLSELKRSLIECDQSNIQRVVKLLYIETLPGMMQIDLAEYVNSRILQLVLHFCYVNNIKFTRYFQVEELFRQETIYEQGEWVIEKVLNIVEAYKTFNNQRPSSESIRSAIDYIMEYYKDHLTLEMVAEHVGRSSASLNRNFKKETGKTIYEFIIELRLQLAKNDICTPGKSLKQIAEDCGFNSYSHFCICFKTHIGLTPSEYQAKHQLS